MRRRKQRQEGVMTYISHWIHLCNGMTTSSVMVQERRDTSYLGGNRKGQYLRERENSRMEPRETPSLTGNCMSGVELPTVSRMLTVPSYLLAGMRGRGLR